MFFAWIQTAKHSRGKQDHDNCHFCLLKQFSAFLFLSSGVFSNPLDIRYCTYTLLFALAWDLFSAFVICECIKSVKSNHQQSRYILCDLMLSFWRRFCTQVSVVLGIKHCFDLFSIFFVFLFFLGPEHQWCEDPLGIGLIIITFGLSTFWKCHPFLSFHPFWMTNNPQPKDCTHLLFSFSLYFKVQSQSALTQLHKRAVSHFSLCFYSL